MRANVLALKNYEHVRRRLTLETESIRPLLQKQSFFTGKWNPVKEGPNSLPEKKTKAKGNDDYNTVEETWGKRDLSTLKTDPKLGQFQQSPKVPFSK